MPFIIDARNMGGGSIGSAAGGDTSTGTRNNVTLAAPWDENKEYLKGDLATNNGDLYQAQKSVPAGVQISDEDYWALVVAGDKSKETEQLRKDIGSLAELETESKDNLVNAINEVGSIQPDWNQNDETKKDYIKNRPGGYIGETAPTLTLNINATKQDGINKLTDVKVTTDNFIDENSINISIDNGYTMIHRTLTQRFIPGYVINEYGATIYGNAHLIDASQPDTGEDLAMYKDDFGDSAYGIGWHIWATSIPSGDLNVFVEQKSTYTVPFQSQFIPWEASPTATSILYTEQSLTEEEQAQARANIGAGTPYTLPQATAEALGGVKADSAEAADTQPVRIGTDGKLYTAPGLTDISTKMDANNPVGTGSFSMNRKAHTVIGINSHAEGRSTTASGQDSHAEGNSTIASGGGSHAEGFSTTANVVSSHAEGSSTTASGGSSHAEGNRTTASGGSSHAEGVQTTASGQSSHAEGGKTTASGTGSHAEGLNTTAKGKYSHVQGKYNIEDSSSIYADIIGNGTSDTAHSNAATVDWNSNAWFAGDVYTGSTSGTNKDDGSKKLATEEYVNNSIAAGGTDISLGLTSAAVGQTIKVKAVDESGKPTAWEASDAGELKFTKIYEHTVTAEEATTVVEYKITKEAVPNLGKYNIFVGEIEFAEKTAFSKWVKLKVNNADVAQICGGVSTDKAVFFSASANRLFGRWCGINVYDTNKNNGTYMITLPCAYSLIANNALDAESVSIHSYAPDFGLVEGAILRVYAAK